MQTGMFPDSSMITCSARAFVNVYVLGRGAISLGVITSTSSSSIHLRDRSVKICQMRELNINLKV